jgi:hypothetical protein
MLYQRNLSRTFEVATPLRLEMLNAVGDVSIRGIGEPRAEITASIEVYADSPEEADRDAERVAAGIDYDEANGLIVRSPEDRGSGIRLSFHDFNVSLTDRPRLKVSYDIQVPRETQAEVAVAVGRLNVSGIAGPLEARVANGRIEIEDVSGAIDLRAPNGRLTLRRCEGDVVAHVANGKVEAREIGGSLKVDAANGSVEAEAVGGALSVKGANGSVRYRGAVGGDFDLQLTNGAIHLELPSDSRFEVDAESKHGAVRSDFEVKAGPSAGSRAPRLYLRTLNGGIHITELRETSEQPPSPPPTPEPQPV